MSGPEDWDFDKRLRTKGKVILVRTPIFHNETEFNLRKYLAKKGYYAQYLDVYISKWGENEPDLKKQLGFWYRFFGVFFENGKWRRLIANPGLTFGMYFLRIMVGVQFLLRRHPVGKSNRHSPYLP